MITIAMPNWGSSPLRLYMKSKYVQSLRRSGAQVRWLRMTDPKLVEKALACDGLLLPGGDDIDPGRYHQPRTEKCGKSSLLRDETEWKLLQAYLPTGKPVLCICRGVQLLNVFQGGTLHQHIDHHADFKTRAKGCHEAHIQPGTLLSRLLPQESVFVNSLHHQSADIIGQGLTVSARAEDGTVEALELEGHPFCIGVQWHPEHLSNSRPDQQQLFDAFVNQC